MQETLVLGGGCFWCTEAVFERVRGVLEVRSGYANGHVTTAPSYEQVCTGTTGCVEAVRLLWDPVEIGARDVLEIFFATHDPTQLNRQGNDVGTQYRSGVYYSDPAHGELARAMVRELDASGHYGTPIVTEVLPLTRFWPAEDYHGTYFRNHPHQGYCTYVIQPKVHKFRQAFARHLKEGA
ncbi:MAG: peptide-methionine (S)-S-oxide reductase MsrA [Comamonadaceae bacterium]|nr:peptide-methionine (S)-S-oxide reductase MsrA [Burkholderiales bacterium]MEB2348388.1 peptide-methionine (S)-S-oxide reductase MsrA [Comamonadaceae bacterium]